MPASASPSINPYWVLSPSLQACHSRIDVYQAGFDASWEIDVFGGKRRAKEAAGRKCPPRNLAGAMY